MTNCCSLSLCLAASEFSVGFNEVLTSLQGLRREIEEGEGEGEGEGEQGEGRDHSSSIAAAPAGEGAAPSLRRRT